MSSHAPVLHSLWLVLWCLLILTCHAFLIMFQRWWLKPWFAPSSTWLMKYNCTGCLFFQPDERCTLIHSWPTNFDVTCFIFVVCSQNSIKDRAAADETFQRCITTLPLNMLNLRLLPVFVREYKFDQLLSTWLLEAHIPEPSSFSSNDWKGQEKLELMAGGGCRARHV